MASVFLGGWLPSLTPSSPGALFSLSDPYMASVFLSGWLPSMTPSSPGASSSLSDPYMASVFLVGPRLPNRGGTNPNFFWLLLTLLPLSTLSVLQPLLMVT